MMNVGFNTDVRVDGRSFHVQTEDRGPHHGKIDTAVYVGGRVVHKHSTSYSEFDAGVEPSEAIRRVRVEEQHRHIIDALRSGALHIENHEPPKPPPPSAPKPGVVIQILNATSWLAAGQCDLQLEVKRKDDSSATAAGAKLSVHFDGLSDSPQLVADCDASGHARIQFPMPPGAAGGAVLVVQASSEAGEGEIRFNLRARKKIPAGTAGPG
jgi:hypothetical protein